MQMKFLPWVIIINIVILNIHFIHTQGIHVMVYFVHEKSNIMKINLSKGSILNCLNIGAV